MERVFVKVTQLHLYVGVDVELSGTLCQGRCAEGPNVIVDGKIYSKVDPGVMLDILRRTLPPRS